MGGTDVQTKLRQWPAVSLLLLFLAFGVLWIDSLFHVRTFIFLPGGDAGLGFCSEKGRLFWVEHTPWAYSKDLYYMAHWSIRYWALMLPLAALLIWYVVRRQKH